MITEKIGFSDRRSGAEISEVIQAADLTPGIASELFSASSKLDKIDEILGDLPWYIQSGDIIHINTVDYSYVIIRSHIETIELIPLSNVWTGAPLFIPKSIAAFSYLDGVTTLNLPQWFLNKIYKTLNKAK